MGELQGSRPAPSPAASHLDDRPEEIIAESFEEPAEDRPVEELTLGEIEEELEAHYWGTLCALGALVIILGVVAATVLTRYQESSTTLWTWLITVLVVVIAYGTIRRLLFPLWESAPRFATRLLWLHAGAGLAATVTRQRLAELLARRTALHEETASHEKGATAAAHVDESVLDDSSAGPTAPSDLRRRDAVQATASPPGVPEPAPIADGLLGLVRKLGQVKLETLIFVPLGIFGIVVIVSALLEAFGLIPAGLFGPGW